MPSQRAVPSQLPLFRLRLCPPTVPFASPSGSLYRVLSISVLASIVVRSFLRSSCRTYVCLSSVLLDLLQKQLRSRALPWSLSLPLVDRRPPRFCSVKHFSIILSLFPLAPPLLLVSSVALRPFTRPHFPQHTVIPHDGCFPPLFLSYSSNGRCVA